MDLDRRSLKAEGREIGPKGGGVVGVSPQRDAPRLARRGERLAGDRLDLRGRERERFPNEPFGHEAGELRRPVEIALVARFLLRSKLDPCSGKAREARPSPLFASLVPDHPRPSLASPQPPAPLPFRPTSPA